MFLISDALAAEAASPAPGFNYILIIAMVAIFYFLMIRPQNKRQKTHRQMIDNVAKGDEVLTNGGLIGKIIQLSEDGNFLVLEMAENIQMTCQKNAIANMLPQGTIKSVMTKTKTTKTTKSEKTEK